MYLCYVMLIFLDIDGVMVPAKGWKAPELLNDGFPAFSSKAVGALNSLISEDITVLLTTSHKSSYNINQWKSIFSKRGVEIKKLLVLPPNVNYCSRKDEILHWLENNELNEGFVIIDDDKTLNELPLFLKNNLVQTSPYIGFTDELALLAKKILYTNLQTA